MDYVFSTSALETVALNCTITCIRLGLKPSLIGNINHAFLFLFLFIMVFQRNVEQCYIISIGSSNGIIKKELLPLICKA